MKTVLIAGGAGFLGFNLIKYLLCKVEKIIVIDNYITGNETNLKKFIETSKYCNQIDIYNRDICDTDLYEMLIHKYKKINEIYHFASLASPKFYKKYPLHTLDVGYVGSRNLLELALHYTKNGIDCKILLASTSEIYGDPDISPQNENYYGNVNTYGERSSYDESKRVAEALFYTYKNKWNVETRIVRIFNTFGPYMNLNDGRIVTEVIRCLLTGETLTIYGNGEQTRSLCYVEDTIDMIVKIMNGVETSPINVGNNIEISVNEIVEKIKHLYNLYYINDLPLKIQYINIDKDDPKIRNPCLIKNNSTIGKRKYTSLDIGLLKTIEFFKMI